MAIAKTLNHKELLRCREVLENNAPYSSSVLGYYGNILESKREGLITAEEASKLTNIQYHMKINQNEITGAYYEVKILVLNIFLGTIVGIVVVALLASILTMLLDLIFGAETMTELYAEGVMFIRPVL